MPIRARVQRLWRLVVEWWRPSNAGTLQPPASLPSSSSPRQSRRRSLTRRSRPAPVPSPHEGELLVGGAVTVRMWVVGGRLVLATSTAEAERAIATLLPELDPEEQTAAHALLEDLRGGLAAAA